jgi:protein subunit release factor A
MPKFSYIVVNNEDKQLAGVVEAPDAKTARGDLKELGFSVVSLEEKAEDVSEDGLAFEFKGLDKHNRNVSGTIKSEDKYNAFKRLISEYELDIAYLVAADLEESAKISAKKKGVGDLLRKYQKDSETLTAIPKTKTSIQNDPNFKEKKALVERQIKYVLNKVKDLITQHGDKLNPQDKQTIKSFVNKILRIKSSTNLDYIKNTCKSLLEFLQNIEWLSHGKTQIDEKFKMHIETQQMIDNIQHGKDFGIYEDLEDQIIRWRSEHIKGNEKIPFGDKIKDAYYSVLLSIIHEEKDVRTIKKEITQISRELNQYRKMYLTAKDKTYREGASKSLKSLHERRNKLKAKLKEIRESNKQTHHEKGGFTSFEKTVALIKGLSGWLLFFYLTYYFVSTYVITKTLPFMKGDVPSIFYLFQTGTIKYLLPGVFLLHLTTSIKLTFFRKSILYSALMFPVFILGILLTMFNF